MRYRGPILNKDGFFLLLLLNTKEYLESLQCYFSQ